MIDFYGIFSGLFCLLITLIFILYRLSTFKLLTNKLLTIIVISFVCHIVATQVYYLIPSDSAVNFFPNASLKAFGFGTKMAYFISALLKNIGFTTLLSQLYFSNAMGLLGSYFQCCLYILLARECGVQDKNHSYIVYSIIWLWPSFVFWTTGIGKDSLMFLGVSIFFTALKLYKYHFKKSVVLLLFSTIILWMLRPQIFMPIFFAVFLVNFFSNKISLKSKIITVLLVTGFISIMMPNILLYGAKTHEFNLLSIESHALTLQSAQAIGTSFSPPTQNPKYLLLFLPYTACANLFFPLFIGIKNLIGFFASIENILFIFLLYNYIVFRSKFLDPLTLSTQKFIKYAEFYFISGIALLGLINTNLGLAMRQKIMFISPLIILIAVSRSWQLQNKRAIRYNRINKLLYRKSSVT